VQESLNNALRHANAQNIQVQITYTPKQIAIVVRDDGCGFDLQTVSHCSFGIKGMQQRASLIGACLTVDSQIDRGTIVAVLLPNT
jgi:signal transduction histidine kinase